LYELIKKLRDISILSFFVPAVSVLPSESAVLPSEAAVPARAKDGENFKEIKKMVDSA
jgi:hypothetical protein